MPSTISNSRPVSLLRWFLGLVIALAIAYVAGVSVATTPSPADAATVCTAR
jgi:hypothetical protein